MGYAVSHAGFHTEVITFNDRPGRRHKEVLELFDQAIAYAISTEQ